MDPEEEVRNNTMISKSPKSGATNKTPKRPVLLKVRPDGIPAELKVLPRWIGARLQYDPEKKRWGKKPRSPKGSGTSLASCSNPKTWGTFKKAWECYATDVCGWDAVQFVLGPDEDTFTIIDMDHCRHPKTKEVQPWAREIIESVNSYAEPSTSGTGIRIVLKGRKPPKSGCRKAGLSDWEGGTEGEIEIYDHSKLVTITGHHLKGTPTTVEERQTELDQLMKQLPQSKQPSVSILDEPDREYQRWKDQALITCGVSMFGEQFKQLWQGDWKATEIAKKKSSDHSRVDFAFISDLCRLECGHHWDGRVKRFITGEPARRCNSNRSEKVAPSPPAVDRVRVQRIFEQSGMYRPKIKGKGKDYTALTVNNAIENMRLEPNEVRHRTEGKFVPRELVSTLDVAAHKCFPPREWIVEGMLTFGLGFLQGRPKMARKSWMALQLAVAVAHGEPFLNYFPVGKPRRVLLLALEDSEQRIQERLEKLGYRDKAQLANVDIFYEWPKFVNGGLEILDEWLDENSYGLVIIDTLGRLQHGGRKEGYHADYDEIAELQNLTKKHKVCMLCNTHTVKDGAGKSVIDRAQGTTGVTAALDNTLDILVKGDTCVLETIGRDAEQIQVAIKFDLDEDEGEDGDGRGWRVLGDAATVHVTQERKDVLEALQDGPKSLTQLASFLHKKKPATHYLLGELLKKGLVIQSPSKMYAIPTSEND